ncbi:hypothetical protein [Prauserella muralis]|uniref:Uncharacterized protein n=1 Tax=Prauserella muralis TaxID=588067 RepID=A0A2V4BNA2_9PSEU|nr:hypothetical protein [Prauserella muralis]PXY32113.1 hypothetical protein BAY60_07390 [Prauserella muralis]TWE24238.1 hypothetical protein FHX69_5551 [Prauserella muralis]
MGTKDQGLVHVTARKSLWSGRIWALCGATQTAGNYETDTWRLFGLPGSRCPACERIKKNGGKR